MAEQLVNEFTVNRPIDEAWAVITDVEQIAPCLPGAELQEIEGDVYRGVVKVKLGSITPQFKGQATFIDRDDPGHRAVLKAEGAGHRRPRQRRRRDHRPGREPVADQHPVHRDDRSAHHRPGRPVRARHPRRRVEEADGPVRQQPQHDARRPGRAEAAGGRQRRHRPARRRRDATSGRCRRRRPAVGDRRPAARRRRAVGPASPGSARSKAPPPSRSTSPAWPARRSSSASPRCSPSLVIVLIVLRRRR